jgi:hypothetical protein
MSDFYPAFSSTCFVVLTLWLMAVVQRYGNWENNRPMIQRAFGIGLFFSLPGIMTLVALVDPDSPRLWEWTYTLVALSGAGLMVTLFVLVRDRMTTFAYLVAVVLYLAIGAVAIVGLTRSHAHLENQVDQVLLCVLLFLGLNAAWFLLFAPSKRAGGARSDARDPAASTRAAAAD